MFHLEQYLDLTDKERLILFGYKPHHIIEYPDGTAILDLEKIRLDMYTPNL